MSKARRWRYRKGIAERIDTVGARRAEAAGIGPWGELRSGLMRYPAAWPASGMAAGLGGESLSRVRTLDSGEGAAPEALGATAGGRPAKEATA